MAGRGVSLCVLPQQLTALQINEVQAGTSGAGYRLEFSVGRILVFIVEGVLNAEVGIRTVENERVSHSRIAAV
jgi:hypothetical protein